MSLAFRIQESKTTVTCACSSLQAKFNQNRDIVNYSLVAGSGDRDMTREFDFQDIIIKALKNKTVNIYKYKSFTLANILLNDNYSMQKRGYMNKINLLNLFQEDYEPLEEQESKKVTGYRIYNADQKRRIKRNDLPDLYPDLPTQKYDIIYADPPWDYGGKLQFDKTSTCIESLDYSKNIFISSANFKYPTLKIQELKKIPLNEISENDCLLFMWVTNPHLAQGIELGQHWGFNYKTVAFIWDKMVHNPGKYTLSYCELCLVFKKGRIPHPRGTRNEKQLIRSPRGAHSVKPTEVREAIERMFPAQKKIELFARCKPINWDVWGLDVREVYE